MREARFSVILFFLLEEVKAPLTGTRKKGRKGTRAAVSSPRAHLESEGNGVRLRCVFFRLLFPLPASLVPLLRFGGSDAKRLFGGASWCGGGGCTAAVKAPSERGVPATSPRASPRGAFVRTFNAFRRNARVAPRAPVAPPRGRLCESEVKASSYNLFVIFFFAGRLLEKSCAFTLLLIARFATHHANFVFSSAAPLVSSCRFLSPSSHGAKRRHA